MAVTAARSGLRTLVISTDPAPSLGDALARPLSAAPRAVPLPRGTLHAVEIDAPRALERWLATRRGMLERIAIRGTWLDEDDVARLLRLSLPGIDEIAALLEVVRFGRTGRFDLVVVDTAPTGHTLRMLTLPGTLARLAQLFDAMQQKHRTMVDTLRGGWTPDAEDALVEEIDRDAQDVGDLLRDAARTEAAWVTLPEAMAVAEAADGITALAAQRITVSRIIVNRLTPAAPSRCHRCDARRAMEAGALATLTSAADGRTVAAVLAREREPRGVPALATLGKEIGQERPIKTHRRTVPPWRAHTGSMGSHAAVPDLAGTETRLLMFGGKGGVGKTTCAAAAALAAAQSQPARRVLLLSTDPAHSLGDALGCSLSDEPRTVPGGPKNLVARELDAAHRFATIRQRYAEAIESLFDRITRGSAVDAGHDRVVMRDLMDLAPPGIDELAGIADVTDTLTTKSPGTRVDLLVMDMAPSGHALRLLETPALVQDWAKVLMSILLKYQTVVGIGELGELLLRLSQGLGRLRELLRDPARTRFVAVTRAAALPRAETLRLVRRLARMRIPVNGVLINAVGRGTCARCRREEVVERREMETLVRALPRRVEIVTAPAEYPPPFAAAALREWASRWALRA
jgi:arsenite-transporting ATPase